MKGMMSKLSANDVDIDFLDELIEKCEESMASRFRKPKESAMAHDDHGDDEDGGMMAIEISDDKQDELSDDDIADLLSEFRSSKG